MSQFSPELCKLESSNVIYICRMSDCIVGLRLWVMALIFLFLSIFLSFPKLQVNIKNLCWSFLRNFKARMMKLCIHMDNEFLYCGIANQTPCLSIFLSFLDQFLSHFLRN